MTASAGITPNLAQQSSTAPCDGNTEAMAEAIATALAARGEKRIRIHNAGKDSLSHIISDAFRYDGLIVGVPTYSMTLFPPVDTFMKAMQTRETQNKVLGLFSSFTLGISGRKGLGGYAEATGLQVAAKTEMKQGINNEIRADIEKFADSLRQNCTNHAMQDSAEKDALPTESHPLKPFLPKNARLLMCGTFPPKKRNGRWNSITRIS